VESVLQDLHANFSKSVSGPLYWPELSTLESRLDDEKSGKFFPISFKFPSFSIALTVATYWSNMMVIHNQLSHAYDRLKLLTPTENGSHLTIASVQQIRERDSTWQTMAKNVCQSLEYFLHDNMGSFSHMSILALLSGCYSCFGNAPGDWSREMGWISDSLQKIKKRLGLPAGNLLGG